ncbi:tyrosine-type recombinase/integrase [Mycolicibacterium austroafricanum]|uniref:tyrosine-type recombinase/integrase n=1 Tax=Mycolicibacterium austroafricanum TaxID=39687 RepID=UPI001CA32FB0|nr:site-specific integrase [Mycolicibacterium austroafricanum]QZT54615.1 site-specific integrase [Mycolicibacterium austroafricanum]
MSRNANGEGSIYPWKRDGKPAGYKGALSYKDEDGATKRYVCYGRTRKEVKDKLDKARDRLDDGAPVKDSKQSIGEWLAYWRKTGLAASSRKESTKVLYGNLSRKHLEPAPFGAIRLDRLKPTDVDTLLLTLRQKDKPLADSTIFNIYCVLRAGLDGAVRDGLIAKNIAAKVDRPQVTKKDAQHIDAADLTKLLASADGLRYRDVLVLIAGTGMRRGEAVALAWSKVSLDTGTMRVDATLSRVGKDLLITEPKTERSRRTVPLSPAMVSLLRSQKARQAAERLRAGDQWTDTGLVFTTELGTAVDPRNILRTVELAAKKAGLGKVGVHTLRHSAATGWLESGVHIKAVSDLLGHSSISITGDIYGHTSDDTARKAIEGWSGALGL